MTTIPIGFKQVRGSSELIDQRTAGSIDNRVDAWQRYHCAVHLKNSDSKAGTSVWSWKGQVDYPCPMTMDSPIKIKYRLANTISLNALAKCSSGTRCLGRLTILRDVSTDLMSIILPK